MTVYVVQIPRRRDAMGEWQEVHDITTARAFGPIVELLPPDARPNGNAVQLVDLLHKRLENYDADKDHLLCLGNPALIGWATAIAADYGEGRVRLLCWQRSAYEEVTAQLFEDDFVGEEEGQL